MANPRIQRNRTLRDLEEEDVQTESLTPIQERIRFIMDGIKKQNKVKKQKDTKNIENFTLPTHVTIVGESYKYLDMNPDAISKECDLINVEYTLPLCKVHLSKIVPKTNPESKTIYRAIIDNDNLYPAEISISKAEYDRLYKIINPHNNHPEVIIEKPTHPLYGMES